jgi:hypothetical protein
MQHRIHALAQKVLHGYEILKDREKKRRHDLALRKHYNEEQTFTQSAQWWKWLTSIGTTIGGGAVIVLGALHGNIPMVIGGGALLSAGISSVQKTYTDPNCSALEFAKVV